MAVAIQRSDQRSDVLLIEDERKMAMVLSRVLSGAGFRVSVAENGTRGMDELEHHEYGLAILDLLLPDVDGVAVLARARVVAPDTPVMVLSAVTDVNSKVVCLELGACDYVPKPCELPELVARVRLRVGRPARPMARRELRSGRQVLDLHHRMVEVDGRRISLTTREFVLLEYLMEHAGETCTRQELLENVWGYTFDPATNVVDVCIGRVRHKLGGESILTVRNVGYCYVGS
jgi:two-component system, OmpR family, response regulator